MLDTNDFCCNEYLQVMVATIKRNWDQNAGGRGVTTMKFTISRDGRLSDIEIERSSGVMTLDRAALRALALTTLQPLPDRYTNPTLTVHIKFEY
jgi:TonB family protein